MRTCVCLEIPHGLMFIVDEDSLQSSLWNPMTRDKEKIALPDMEKALPERCRCLLSDNVSSPDCVVLVYDTREPELLFCHARRRSTSRWVSQTCDLGHLHVAEGRRTMPP